MDRWTYIGSNWDYPLIYPLPLTFLEQYLNHLSTKTLSLETARVERYLFPKSQNSG